MNFLSAAIRILIITCLIVLPVMTAMGAPASPEIPSSAPWTWPLPPETPRVQHLKTVITPQDLGVTKGFFQKIWEFIAGEDTADRIISPHGVVADGEGKVYVADWGAGSIHYFDFKKKKYDIFSKTKSGTLKSPIGIALDDEGMVYVSDSILRRIFVFSGTKNKRIIGDDSLLRPTGIAINKKEKRLYVVDTIGHRVDVYDLEGKKQYSFGSQGSQEGKFNYPTHIAIDAAGGLYVMDSLNFRVQMFDKSGKFLAQFGGTGTGIHDFMKPKGIAVDSEGHIWVSDSYRNTVQVFDRKGTLLLIFGKLGIGQGEFNVPEGLYIDGKDRLIVADSYNYRIQMFQYLKADARN
jgi:DNA-binding beta-propeller fold protein YncE